MSHSGLPSRVWLNGPRLACYAPEVPEPVGASRCLLSNHPISSLAQAVRWMWGRGRLEEAVPQKRRMWVLMLMTELRARSSCLGKMTVQKHLQLEDRGLYRDAAITCRLYRDPRAAFCVVAKLQGRHMYFFTTLTYNDVLEAENCSYSYQESILSLLAEDFSTAIRELSFHVFGPFELTLRFKWVVLTRLDCCKSRPPLPASSRSIQSTQIAFSSPSRADVFLGSWT